MSLISALPFGGQRRQHERSAGPQVDGADVGAVERRRAGDDQRSCRRSITSAPILRSSPT